MVVGKVHNNRNKHGEGLLLVALQDVQEIVVLEEAHSSVSNLQVDASNASHDSLEKAGNQVLDLVNFADFKNFLKFSEEKGLFDAVSIRPVSEQTVEERDSK